MKKLITILILAVLLMGCSHSKYLAFAPDEKYGKLPTKKARPVKEKTVWRFDQWGR